MGEFGKAALPGMYERQRRYCHTRTTRFMLETKADQATHSVP